MSRSSIAGRSGATTVGATLEIVRGEDRVTVIRAAHDIPTPPHMRRLGLAPRADMTKMISYAPPSNITIDIDWKSARRGGRQAAHLHSVIINSITPETERSCHYFWGHVRDFDTDNADMTAYFHRAVVTAFNEDKDILEAQQRSIELDPLAPTLNVHGDWGGVQARAWSMR